MLAGLSTPRDLRVDRYYRGAIVMVGDAMFSIPEQAIVLIERAHSAGTRFEVLPEDEHLVTALVTQGLLIRDDPEPVQQGDSLEVAS